MAKREKNIQLIVRVSEPELERIRSNMAACGTSNFSMYARKMLLDGYIKKPDYTAYKDVARGLGELARNVHQIAKRANETRHLRADDYERIRAAYYDDFARLKERLVKEFTSEG